MSHLNLFINTDNAAFVEGGVDEVKAVIARAVQQLQNGGTGGILRDTNGNPVGMWGYTGDDDRPIRFNDDQNAAAVIVGNPLGGFRLVGPFASHWDAEQFLETADWGDEDDRWAAELSSGL